MTARHLAVVFYLFVCVARKGRSRLSCRRDRAELYLFRVFDDFQFNLCSGVETGFLRRSLLTSLELDLVAILSL